MSNSVHDTRLSAKKCLSMAHFCVHSASSKVLTCNANKTIRENIANLFGAKVVGQIIPVDLSLYDATTASGEEGSDSDK